MMFNYHQLTVDQTNLTNSKNMKEEQGNFPGKGTYLEIVKRVLPYVIARCLHTNRRQHTTE